MLFRSAEVSMDRPEEGDGLRLRHVQHSEVKRQSSDEEDEEEEEFRMPERKEEKSGFSLNHLIIGALAQIGRASCRERGLRLV